MSIRTACLLLSFALLGACQPYIYDPNEYDREQPGFGREPTDRTEVNICYMTRATTAQDILAMAEAECAKFGKTAQYRYTEIGECPLATPALGRFYCVPK